MSFLKKRQHTFYYQAEDYSSSLTPYRLAEKEARDAGIGMWSLGDQYISPKEWRKMHRK
ncbi:MAG: hypothetical protein ACYSUL_13660 [Planctomycetota bacterium]|jgi:endonuclease YncB( thermonuclease family)